MNKTIGGLFKDLECELHLGNCYTSILAILDEIAKIEEVVNKMRILQSNNRSIKRCDWKNYLVLGAS